MKNSQAAEWVGALVSAFLHRAAEEGLAGDAFSQAARALFDGICDGAGGPDSVALEADNAVLEVIDRRSGRLVRRYLELGYQETANGILLSGESLSGQPAQLVYLSETAIGKIHELRGAGEDGPRCDGHDHPGGRT
ncbi:MAG: hypothetical protein GXX99_04910 [Clostridiales bacterium]|nr:hypothetical protein [Clostridiales bacterium]